MLIETLYVSDHVSFSIATLNPAEITGGSVTLTMP